ncbi:hypothetical protein N7462_001541 [Penicillium macrosclerotiorum]|uniref:uncharacterized protein n=1 Tax=Penicillium macrosclerotiorum TaxID=303699 RepID=UPI0025475F19|nr:uncharacterized protein N7462_001541 [Penicillium macrosclerotiorum]KAJ5692118.1 hypothetical protein N7462_001541 [Penicillium macrosclerotiorum]
MAPSRHHIGTSRRKRRDDEGEDEGSLAGDLEDDSLSEGSVDSRQDEEDADGEGSESDGELSTTAATDKLNGSKVNGRELPLPQRHSSASPSKPALKTTVSDTEAMLNGLKISDEGEEILFDQMGEDHELQMGRTPSAPPTEPKRDTLATRKRREHEKFVKERDQNPAFVPSRGSFFLHDKRSSEPGTNGFRPFNKGKSRPYGLIVDGNARRSSSKPDASEGQWTHDLHETVAGDKAPAPKHPAPSTAPPAPPPIMTVPTAPRSSPPNRSFSSTTLVGNVPVVVLLPGMAQAKPFPAVPKKQHTRLPQHRPPLRRDKPVRISLPGQEPRYIFPSTERSFIFIPRALRPNQQGYRGRGRGGSFYGPPRRPSYYPNSYASSVMSMSRRSSFGLPPSQDGYPSPAGSVYSRPSMIPPDVGKPIVRLPPPPRPPVGMPPAGPGVGLPPGMMLPIPFPHPAYRESRPATIPMHQPRPQKAVSVADIESPATFPFNPQQTQQDQPFHHQVPAPAAGPGQEQPTQGSSQPSGTPLSQIPERAIHAQPFQPFGYPPQPAFYPGYAPGATMYYPAQGPEFASYNGPMGPGASMPNFPPGQQSVPYAGPSSSGEQPSQPGMVAHESGGTVYFYDANQMYSNPTFGVPGGGPGPGPGGVVGMGGMMTPPGTAYYYAQPSGGGGVYYGPQ